MPQGSLVTVALTDPRLRALQRRIDGEVRADRWTRYLYSTDGSIYEIQPLGVVFPRDEEDVLATVAWAREHRVPLIPRGAGTSLAGQTVGEGVVLDFTRYMDRVVAFDPDARRITVEPGIVCDHVNRYVAPYRLRFAPDPSTSNRATIGGMIGNNASGAHSIKYGTTADCIASLRVVLANGEIIETRPLAVDGPELASILRRDTLEAAIYRTILAIRDEYADDIRARYPDIPRNVSGYNLKHVVRDGVVDLTRLFCGAEGTLGIVTRATLILEPLPAHRALAVLCFDDLVTAMEAVEPLRVEDVSAVELIDRMLLDLALQTPYARVVRQLPAGTVAMLVVEVEGEDRDEVIRRAQRIRDLGSAELRAIHAEARTDADEQRQIWNMRKAAVPLMFRMPGDAKPVPFIEDMAVSPSVLPEYVRGLQRLFERHGVRSVIYAHASVGCLHLRPVINLKEPEEVEKMARIARDACQLVMSLGGVMSGEHGDGLARTQWNRVLYGERLWEAFRRLKRAFDPEGLLNPGKICADDADLRRHHRYCGDYQTVDWPSMLDFSDQGSFQQAVELCNGCGHCRKATGTMCPTFRALNEEIMTTRGRANLIRGALAGRLDPGSLFSEEFRRQVLDYCIGCKGCRVECPSGVDLARIKAEVLYHYHQRHGKPLRSLLFAHIRLLQRWGSATAPVSNRLLGSHFARRLAEWLLGIDHRRALPSFARVTLSAWMRRAGLVVPQPGAATTSAVGKGRGVDGGVSRRVLLFPDCFVDFSEPEVGQAAVRVLQRAGCDVRLAPAPACCGRPAISEGLLDEARAFARRNLQALLPYVDAGWDVVVVEPSCAASFRHELRDLLGHDDEGARRLSEHVFDVTEYLGRMLDAGELTALTRAVVRPEGLERLTYHGHCHQKAMLAHLPTARVLEAVAGVPVDVIDAGCCGMAGSFGYKREHYDFSVKIAEPVRRAIQASAGTLVASGTSCRTQFADLYGWQALHPMELLDRLTGGEADA